MGLICSSRSSAVAMTAMVSFGVMTLALVRAGLLELRLQASDATVAVAPHEHPQSHPHATPQGNGNHKVSVQTSA